VEDLDEESIGGLLARAIKARCAESDVKTLPFAGRLARIHFRRMTLVALLALASRRFPALINRTAILLAQLGLSKAVEHLHFVAVLEIDARVGAFRDAKLDVQLAIAPLADGLEVHRLVGATVEQHPGSGCGEEGLVVGGIEADALYRRPSARRRF